MYTLQPIVQPEPAYIALFILLIVPGAVCAGIVAAYFEGKKYEKVKQIISIIVIAFIVPALISYNQEIPARVKNEKTTGKYIGMLAEGHVETTRSGKNNNQVSRKEISNLYVQYKIDAGIVTLPASRNTAYPEYAVIYKN